MSSAYSNALRPAVMVALPRERAKRYSGNANIRLGALYDCAICGTKSFLRLYRRRSSVRPFHQPLQYRVEVRLLLGTDAVARHLSVAYASQVERIDELVNTYAI